SPKAGVRLFKICLQESADIFLPHFVATTGGHDFQYSLQVGYPIPSTVPEFCEQVLILVPTHPSREKFFFRVICGKLQLHRTIFQHNGSHGAWSSTLAHDAGTWPGRASTTTHLLAVLQSKGYTTSHVERTYPLHFCPAPRERVLRSTAVPPACGPPPYSRTRSARERPGCSSWCESSRHSGGADERGPEGRR